MDFLCPAPWDHHCVNTNGRNRLCCNAVTSESKFIDNFENYWQGEELTSVRNDMINGKKPSACISCWGKESIGVKSLRQQFIENYKLRNEWETFCKDVSVIKPHPIELDLKLGNYCNLACRMCSSFSSSTYATEFKTIYKDTGIDYGINEHELSFVQGKWYNDPKFVITIQQMIDNGLRQLKFTGGEPLMVPSVKKLLDYCIVNNKAKDIDLVLITNGTLLNQTWIDILSQFKHVSFILSVDGTGNTFEYIRHPAKWSKIVEVFELLSKTTMYKSIAFTLQSYNVLDIVNIVNISRHYKFNIDLIALDTPGYLDVSFIPTRLKEAALEKIKSIIPINANEETFLTNAVNKILSGNFDNNLSQQLLDLSKLKDKYKKQSFDTLEIGKYYG